MSNLSEILRLIDEAKAEGDVNKLTALYKRFEEVGLPPTYLVHKARAIQLSDGLEYTLDDAERFLQQAIDMDSHCLEAYLELGYLHYSVNDAPDKALVVFDQGVERAKEIIAEIDLGRAKALAQLGRVEEALTIVNNSYYADCNGFDSLRYELERRVFKEN